MDDKQRIELTITHKSFVERVILNNVYELTSYIRSLATGPASFRISAKVISN